LSADQGNAEAQWLYGLHCVFELNCDVDQGARYLEMSANQGNAYAQVDFSRCLYSGRGVVRDLEQSAKYARLSAEQGDSNGQLLYGQKLLNGEGVDQNSAEGLKFLRLSAEQGCDDARWEIGHYYLQTPESMTAEAVDYLRMAAERGSVRAQRDYARCCLLGLGVPADFSDAIDSYLDAVKNSDTCIDAQVIVAAYFCCDRLKDLDVEDEIEWVKDDLDSFNAESPPRWIEEAEKLMLNGSAESDIRFALHELRSTADDGNRTARLLCGLWLRSRVEGIQYLRLAADDGENRAMLALLNLYRDRCSMVHLSRFEMADSSLIAARWQDQKMTTLAIEIIGAALTNVSVVRNFLIGEMPRQHHRIKITSRFVLRKFGQVLSSINSHWAPLITKSRILCAHQLGFKLWLAGWCYENGCGVELNLDAAADCYRRSSEAGFRLGQYHYALFLCHGVGIRKDLAAAVRQLGLAAESENVDAMIQYGISLEYGAALNRELVRAVYYYEKAAA
jgi:TPR repeat protein